MRVVISLGVALVVRCGPAAAAPILTGGLPQPTAPNGVAAVPWTTPYTINNEIGPLITSARFTLRLTDAAGGSASADSNGEPRSLDNVDLDFGRPVYGWSVTFLRTNGEDLYLNDLYNTVTVGAPSSAGNINGLRARSIYPVASSTLLGTLCLVTQALSDADLRPPPPFTVADIPEPATFALLETGVVGAGITRRRRAN